MNDAYLLEKGRKEGRAETWDRLINILGNFTVECFCDEGGTVCRDCIAAQKLKGKIEDARAKANPQEKP